MSKNKTALAISLILMFAMTITLVYLPFAQAHDPPWNIVSYAYLVASPNPVGVGQTVAIVMWIDAPLPSSAVTNDIRRKDYTLTITAPDGKVETQHWDVISDTTNFQSYYYTPTQVGTYTLKFDYGGQVYTWSGVYQNDTFLPASKTITLTVQEEKVPEPIASYPLPTEYWARPIEGQNTYWYAIASHWLGAPYITGAGAGYGIPGAYQPYGIAPNSAHVMWAKPIQFGGVVGGDYTEVNGTMFYQGGSYNVRFSNPIIMYGILYYQEPYGNSGSGGDYVAVDLRTGTEVWRINASATGVSLVPSFGYFYDYESPNQHGVLPNGLLIATTTAYTGLGTVWRAYDPRTGVLTTMNITNVPSGSSVPGPKGEILRYVLTNLGTTTNPNWYLAQWNSSKVFGAGTGISPSNWYSGTVNASLPSRYDWNISLSLPKGTWSIGTAGQGALPLVDRDNIMLLIQGTFGGHPGDFGATVTTDPANITAISLKPATRGNVLWTKTYPPAPGNNTRFLTEWDPTNGVFIFADKESLVHYGYSLADGNLLWGPVGYTDDFTNDWNFLALYLERVAYGRLYVSGYAGILYCYNVTNGKLLWTYGNGGPGNSTYSGLTTPWGRYPIFISVIADGKIYLDTTEHSPNSPLYKGARFRCVDAYTGKEIWTLMGYGNQMYGGQLPIADGYWAILNTYDCRIYCIGKGPSATSVSIQNDVVTHGSKVLVKGSVIDIAPGTKQHEQAARFPNGVPAVADESMGEWMEYVYMQKPRPSDVKGVEVVVSVLDPNGNCYEVARATSDADGFYSATFEPPVPGKYTVIAEFKGSESYWPSHAKTALYVEEAPPATPPPTATPVPLSEQYFLPMSIGMIAAIIVIIILLVLLLLRKR